MYVCMPENRADKIIEVLRLTNTTFSNFLSGQCLEACILGTMFVITLSILRMPYALLIGIIIAVSALIPIVGAFIGCIVGVILIMMTSPLKALIFVGDSLYYSRLKEILYILMLLEALSDYREYGCLLLLQSVAICLV